MLISVLSELSSSLTRASEGFGAGMDGRFMGRFLFPAFVLLITFSTFAWSGEVPAPECQVVVAPSVSCQLPLAPRPLCPAVVAPERICSAPVAPTRLCPVLAFPQRICALPVAPTCVPGTLVAPRSICSMPVSPIRSCTRYVVQRCVKSKFLRSRSLPGE
jgi:hypothetical protein